MAIDAYLHLDGIKGESTDEGHLGWIECDNVFWSVLQPKSATASTAGGHTAERAELSDITFSKVSDLASPILLQTCAQGRTIPKAKFEFMRADGGASIKYFEIELECVLIGGVTPSLVGGIGMTEAVALKFGKVRWKYIQQKISGGGGGNTSGGWNLMSNRTT
jgi:type VI secretion system secreted protein Hcp